MTQLRKEGEEPKTNNISSPAVPLYTIFTRIHALFLENPTRCTNILTNFPALHTLLNTQFYFSSLYCLSFPFLSYAKSVRAVHAKGCQGQSQTTNWDFICTVLLLSHEILDRQLGTLIAPFGGCNEGFGCQFVNHVGAIFAVVFCYSVSG